MKLTARIVLLPLICLLLMPSAVDAGDDAAYHYLYAGQTAPDTVTLYQVDPLAPETATTIEIPAPGRLTQMSVSPDGKTAVLIYERPLPQGPVYVRLDIPSYTTRIITEVTEAGYIDAEASLMAWSPDSRYFIFTKSLPSEKRDWPDVGELAIYTLADDRLTVRFDFSFHQLPIDLAWSANSRRLAYVYVNCSDTECGSDGISVLGFPGAEAITSQPFSFDHRALNLCDTAFSPDGRYITFHGGCVSQIPDLPSEMFMWDSTIETESGSPHVQLTHDGPFSLVEAAPTRLIPWVSFSSLWYDDRTFLVGVRVSVLDPGVGVVQETYREDTWLLNPAAGTRTQLSDDLMEDWSRNPVTGTIAFQHTTSTTDFVKDDYGILEPDHLPGQVEIATFDGQVFTPLFAAPPGQDLTWSPDGRILGYRSFYPYRLIFVDTPAGGVTAHPLPVIGDNLTPTQGVFIGGWVVAD